MNQKTQTENNLNSNVLYMAMELSKKNWKLGFGIGNRKCREINVSAGNFTKLEEAIEKSKKRFGLEAEIAVLSCYEAGRDGFWIHRTLTALGIDNIVMDPASIAVNRRKRRAKNDRIDVKMLLKNLVRYHEDDPEVVSVVRVPSVEDEDERRIHRELDRLKKERTGHRNRIQALLATIGLIKKPTKDFDKWLNAVQLWDGSEIPKNLKAELKREYARLQLVEQQQLELKQMIKKRIKKPEQKGDKMAAMLTELVAIGPLGAWILVKELFAWRALKNRKQVGAIVGLVPTPFDSGDSEKELGISKAGNVRVRALMTQLAWSWVRYQPESKITKWFLEKCGGGSKRSRRVGIIAVARRLLIALWRWVDQGVVPEGARLSAV